MGDKNPLLWCPGSSSNQDINNHGILWAPSQYKDGLSRDRNCHDKGKAVVRPSYLYNGNSYTGKTTSILRWAPGPWFNIKMLSYQYRGSHCGDKTVVRSSYHHNGISYTGKISSLYWIRPLVSITEQIKVLTACVAYNITQIGNANLSLFGIWK